MRLEELIPILQLAVGPVILVSGVGLILLSMTNRFGRVIDRSRQLVRELKGAEGPERERGREQLRILSKRARLIRAGIACGAVSALLAALLVIGIFVGGLLQLNVGVALAALFIACMLALIGALLLFISDINLSLQAFWLEVEGS